jgi:hypothetical protein
MMLTDTITLILCPVAYSKSRNRSASQCLALQTLKPVEIPRQSDAKIHDGNGNEKENVKCYFIENNLSFA